MHRIILVGNPNTGKTTLFNTLTKSFEKASNWHGVTVGVKSKKYKYDNEEYLVDDTPGTYSLNGYSNEEKITTDYLNKHKSDLIVNICDANNLKRNMLLTKELVNSGFNVIIAVNMSNEIRAYNYDKLMADLNVQIVEIDARKKKSVELLKGKIKQYFSNKKPQKVLETSEIIFNIDDYKIKIAKNNPYSKSDKIDRLVLNKWLFAVVFICTLFLVFYIVFGPVGKGFSNIISYIFNKIIDNLRNLIFCVNISYPIKLLICDGVLGTFSTIISFVPQILLLMFFINLLEDIGLMSRVAFMLDGVMKRIGLSGKALFSIIMGYGCTTSAVLTTRNLENAKLRKRAVLLLPFATCSAKLPIFLIFSSLFFKEYQYLFVLGLYLLAIIVQILYAVILDKFNKLNQQYLILEMPKYRLPSITKIFRDCYVTLKDFIIKTGGVLVIFGILMWILQNFDIKMRFLNGENFSSSLLYLLSSKLSFVFKPLGLCSPAIVVALVFGLVAKELLIVGLAMMNGVLGNLELLGISLLSANSVCYFTFNSALVFLVFVLLYTPCFSSLSVIKSEMGIKTALYVFFVQFVIAYIFSFFAKLITANIVNVLWIALVIVLAIILLSMLKSKCNRKCKESNCSACRNF